jgi:hypothetical protein
MPSFTERELVAWKEPDGSIRCDKCGCSVDAEPLMIDELAHRTVICNNCGEKIVEEGSIVLNE